jgi:thiamine-monophosphate kinase
MAMFITAVVYSGCMQLRELGERALVDAITRQFGTVNMDDCGTLDDGDHWLLLTSDMVNECTHFPIGTTPYLMGWFIVAINLSDIAAAGGVPESIILTLGLPPHLEVEFIEQLAKGAQACVSKFDTYIIGGDTKEVPTITLCGTALGRVSKKNYLSRKGASPGDYVCVTGVLGSAGVALQKISGANEIVPLEQLLKISPRLAAGQAAAATGGVTAAMDLSDGLTSSLYQLMDLNHVGFLIDAEAVLITEEGQDCKPSLDLALHSGGDYELLFTVTPDAVDQVKKAVESTGVRLTPIGQVIETRHVTMIHNGTEKELPNKGYEHFASHGKTL